jgi:hypothetical protein
MRVAVFAHNLARIVDAERIGGKCARDVDGIENAVALHESVLSEPHKILWDYIHDYLAHAKSPAR